MFESALVLVRIFQEGANKGDCDLLLAARAYAARTVALCLGAPDAARHVQGLCHEILAGGMLDGRPDALALAALLREQRRENLLVLIRHDSLGMDLGPGLATALDLPFVTNISRLERAAGGLVLVERPEQYGQVLAGYEVDASAGALFTVMPGALPQEDEKPVLESSVVRETPTGSAGRSFLGEVPPGEGGADISSVPVLVAVGRGMRSAENMESARRLAAVLGGEICCSRAAADAGWLAKDRQVGISGQSVSPALYVALGLHGAFQHMLGVHGAPYIVAVNTNPDAPIFRHAALGAVADAATLADCLLRELEKTDSGSCP